MKYIWLGIKDYCKDCWHDVCLFLVWKLHPRKNRRWQAGHYGYYWKEGNLWHYIKQYKVVQRVVNERKKYV